MRAAFSEKKITPENSIQLDGFGGRNKLSERVVDDLFLRAAALEDDKGQRVIIVSADILSFNMPMNRRIRYWAEKKLGLDAGRIIFNASHTHYGPMLAQHPSRPEWSVDSAYVDFFEQAVMHVIEEVNHDLFDAKITYTPAKAHFGINRRYPKDGIIDWGPLPEGYYDPDFPVFAVYDTQDNLKSLIYSYACHPTSGGYGNSNNYVSADFPGAVAAALKERCGKNIVPMFLQGAGGTIKNANRDRTGFFDANEMSLEEQGRQIADIVLAAAASGSARELRLDLKTSGQIEFGLPYDLETIPSKDELLAIVTNAKERRQVKMWARNLFEGMCTNTIPESHPMTVSAVRLCKGLEIVAMSGEITAELGRRIKDALKCPEVVFLGYCNSADTYVPTAEMIAEGGYEADHYIIHVDQTLPAVYTKDITEIMTDAALRAEKEVMDCCRG